MLPSRAMTWRRDTASELPTTSATLDGRYFSTHGMSYSASPEEDEAAMDLSLLGFEIKPSGLGGKAEAAEVLVS